MFSIRCCFSLLAFLCKYKCGRIELCFYFGMWLFQFWLHAYSLCETYPYFSLKKTYNTGTVHYVMNVSFVCDIQTMLYSLEILSVFHCRGITNLLAASRVLLLYMATLTGKGTIANLEQAVTIPVSPYCCFWLILLMNNHLELALFFFPCRWLEVAVCS